MKVHTLIGHLLNKVFDQILQTLRTYRRNSAIRWMYIYILPFLKIAGLQNSGLGLRRKFIKESQPDCILDIGANIGQFRTDVRSVMKKVRIISFEPLKSNFKSLKKIEKVDSNFKAVQMGIGKAGKFQINVASNSGLSSSIYASEKHSKLYKQIKFRNVEEIQLITLIEAMQTYAGNASNIMLKIDVQGAENDVLNGLKKVSKLVRAVIVESSYTNLYSSGTTFFETIRILGESGFEVVYIENLGQGKTTSRYHYCDIYAIRDVTINSKNTKVQ